MSVEPVALVALVVIAAIPISIMAWIIWHGRKVHAGMSAVLALAVLIVAALGLAVGFTV